MRISSELRILCARAKLRRPSCAVSLSLSSYNILCRMCVPTAAGPADTAPVVLYIYSIYKYFNWPSQPGTTVYIYIGRNESKMYRYIEKKKNGRYIRPILFYDRHQSSAIVVVPATAENGEKKNIYILF